MQDCPSWLLLRTRVSHTDLVGAQACPSAGEHILCVLLLMEPLWGLILLHHLWVWVQAPHELLCFRYTRLPREVVDALEQARLDVVLDN